MRKHINKIVESIHKEVSRAKLMNKLVFGLLNFADKFYCLEFHLQATTLIKSKQ